MQRVLLMCMGKRSKRNTRFLFCSLVILYIFQTDIFHLQGNAQNAH